MGDSYPATELLSPSSVVEKYVLDGSDNIIRFSNGRNVVLSLLSESGGNRERDSARVHTKTITDFKGDGRNQNSRLLTVKGDFIACHLHFESTGDVIRIIDRVSRNRQMLKNFDAVPVDLQYAPHAPLLAVLDKRSNVYVYTVKNECQVVEKYIKIYNLPDSDCDDGGTPRLAWCPYTPENPADPTDECHMLAVFKGKKVHVINILILCERFGHEDVDYEAALGVEEAVLTIELDEDVKVVCISPDSTAVAVGFGSGVVSFYVINESEIKFAHNWNPRLKSAISDLFFLDDISSPSAVKTEPERFWRHCVVVGDDGRRLALFECETWRCLGTLRFDCELDISKFTAHVDPKMRFVHLLDTDGSNIFCIELDQRSSVPRFLSITQITFCRSLSSVFPYDVKDTKSEAFGTYDDSDSESDNDVTAFYIAIGQKSLVQLDVHLEKSEGNQIQASIYPDDATRKSSDALETIPAVELNLPSTDIVGEPDISPNAWQGVDLNTCLVEINNKLDQIAFRVDRADSERRASATNEHIIQLLQQFKEEFSLREDRLLANISDLIETNRTETINVVRNALNENSVAVENSIQANHKQSSDAISQRVSEKMRDAIAGLVVPAVDKICSQLFKQMNETFRLGLEQYMIQFRAMHNATMAAVVASSTPAHSASVPVDRLQLVQLIKSGQSPLAFETILNTGDHSGLDFVCNNIDPDEFFAAFSLPQPILLSLLQQLSLRIESDTDLKFRYFEHILEILEPDDPQTKVSLPGVLNGLTNQLNQIQLLSSSQALKRQARVLNQLVKNVMKN